MQGVRTGKKWGRFCAFDRYMGENRGYPEEMAVKIFFILWLL